MAKGERIDRSFLGDAALRLARIFDISGLVSPSFETAEKIMPMVLLGDGTLPGMGGGRGRRFAGAVIQAGGAGAAGIGIRAQADILIEEIQVSTQTAAQEFLVHFLGVNDADPFLIATPTTSVMLDRSLNVTESGPVLTGAVTPFLIGVARTIWRNTLSANSPVSVACVPFFLQRGAGLTFQGGVAATVDVNFYGRTF